MGFIQIIEYETERPDEIRALGDERMEADGAPPPGFRMAVTKDRDHPNRYYTIVEFSSYEEAMANSNNPSTHEFAMKMAALCSSPPRFYNLDVQVTVP
jgi:hypothetical protein